MLFRLLCAVSLVGLSACGGGGSGRAVTGSGFAPVNDRNQIDTSLGEDAIDTGGSKGDVGYAYAVTVDGNRLNGLAGLVNAQDLRVRPVTGTGSYDADFKIAEVRDTNVSRDATLATGTLPVRVNFDTGGVAGHGDGLSISGQLAEGGTAYTGTSTWRGVTGDLRGRADKTRIIGAFAGNSPTSVYAGGLSGNGSVKR